MPDKVSYEYAVIRLVPKVEREEFLNVGVMLMSKRKKFLGIKYRLDKARIKAFAKDIDLEMVLKYLKAWEMVGRGKPEGGRIGQLDLHERFRWLTASRSTIIQSSEVHTGICDDPAAVLEDLLERYVL